MTARLEHLRHGRRREVVLLIEVRGVNLPARVACVSRNTPAILGWIGDWVAEWMGECSSSPWLA